MDDNLAYEVFIGGLIAIIVVVVGIAIGWAWLNVNDFLRQTWRIIDLDQLIIFGVGIATTVYGFVIIVIACYFKGEPRW